MPRCPNWMCNIILDVLLAPWRENNNFRFFGVWHANRGQTKHSINGEYEVSDKLAFVITKWSEFISKDKEILATWKGIECFMFLGASAMVYTGKEDVVYCGQQIMIEFGLIGPEGHTLIGDGVLVKFLVRIVVHGFNHPTNHGLRSCWECPFVCINETYLLKFWVVINCFGVVGVFNGQDALRYWCSG